MFFNEFIYLLLYSEHLRLLIPACFQDTVYWKRLLDLCLFLSINVSDKHITNFVNQLLRVFWSFNTLSLHDTSKFAPLVWLEISSELVVRVKTFYGEREWTHLYRTKCTVSVNASLEKTTFVLK